MKKYLSLDFVIVLLFGFMALNQIDSTATFSFVLFFVVCLIYLLLDYLIASGAGKGVMFYKKVLFFLLIGIVVVVPLVSQILYRAEEPNVIVHDNVEQLEPAVEFLLAGQNPYEQNYAETKMVRSSYIRTTLGKVIVNPALFHVISLPSHLLLSVPVYMVFEPLFGFWDQRILYLLFFIISVFVLWRLPRENRDKFSLVAFYTLNPLFVVFFMSGRNDVLLLSLIIFCIYSLKRKKIFWSAVFLAVAVTTKHSAVFLVPFYFSYLYLNSVASGFWNRVLSVFKKTWIFFVLFVVILLPFILWSPADFYADTIAYPSGSIETSYPINGYGVSMWLYQIGKINTIFDYVPFWMVQIPLGLLLMFYLIKAQKKNNTLSFVLVSFGVLAFVFWLFSRFFHDNYIGFLSQIFLIAYFIDNQNDKKII